EHVFHAEQAQTDNKFTGLGVVHVLRHVVRLMGAVLVVGAAEEREVMVEPVGGGRVGVGEDGTVGVVGQKETAGFVATLDRGVGVHTQSGDAGRAVHDQVHAAVGDGRVQRRLEQGGVVVTAAGVDVTVEFGAGGARQDGQL